VSIFILLIVFQIKHLLADYLLQNEYMLGKFKQRGWIMPLAAHSAVHGAFTMAIVYVYSSDLTLSIGLSGLDMALHFIMDRVKASPNLLGKYKAIDRREYLALTDELALAEWEADSTGIRLTKQKLSDKMRDNKIFWLSLGFDQMFHALTHYLIIYIII